MIEYLESSGKNGTPFKIIKSSSYQNLNHSPSNEKTLTKYESTQVLSHFNRSMSVNPEESRAISFQRSHSL